MAKAAIKFEDEGPPRYTPAELMPIASAAHGVAACHIDARLLPHDVEKSDLMGFVLVPKHMMQELLSAYPAEPMWAHPGWPAKVRKMYLKKLRELGMPPLNKR